MKVFVNNFADVMGRRSTETRDGPTLDDRICAIFAALQPGARMLTLNRMLALGPSRDQANAATRAARPRDVRRRVVLLLPDGHARAEGAAVGS